MRSCGALWGPQPRNSTGASREPDAGGEWTGSTRGMTAPRGRGAVVPQALGYSSSPRMSAAVRVAVDSSSLDMTLPNSAALPAFSATTFSSIVSLATSR
jgi:hypothetical protein